jgi:hypothetical protein
MPPTPSTRRQLDGVTVDFAQARQMIPNKAESRRALARDPFHPENRDMYCRKQLRYAAKPQEKRSVRCPPPRPCLLTCRVDGVRAVPYATEGQYTLTG